MAVKNKEKVFDKCFLQEIINDLEKNGYRKGDKAQTMLRDWSRELKEQTGMQGRTKQTHAAIVGAEHYYN